MVFTSELWEYLTDLVFRQDVKDAANLIQVSLPWANDFFLDFCFCFLFCCFRSFSLLFPFPFPSLALTSLHSSQVCKLWRDSPAGQRLRYLLGLAKLSLPVPRLLPFRIAEEASVLLGSTWPLPSARAVYDLHHEQHCWDMPPPLGRPELRGSLLVDLTRDRCGLLVMATEHVARSLPPNTGPSFIPAPSHITQYDVDSDERVVVTMCEECVPYAEAPTSNDAAAAAAAATAAQIDTRSHTAPLKRLALTLHDIDSTLPRGHQLVVKQRYHIAQLELLGSHILFRLEDAVQLRNWRKNWRLVWCREPNEWPVLSAHLLGRDAVMVLSRPQTGDHGLDWASTLELYRVSQVFSRVADIQLPITSKPVRGLNYARTGTRGRLNEKEQDQSGLLVVCVDGYLWLADLASFIELLYPTSAVSLYIPGTATHPVLGTHWGTFGALDVSGKAQNRNGVLTHKNLPPSLSLSLSARISEGAYDTLHTCRRRQSTNAARGCERLSHWCV